MARVFVKRMLTSYSNLLNKYPLRMQSGQTAFLVATGDVIAQTFVEKKNFKNIDHKRTLSFGAVGLVIGPTVGIWYKILDHYLGSGGINVVFKKVACDQILFAPVFCAFALSIFSATRGLTMDEVIDNLRNKYIDVLLANYKIWPLVQFVNFYFIPLLYRVLVVQLVAVVWNTYLSWKVNVKIEQLEIGNVDKKLK